MVATLSLLACHKKTMPPFPSSSHSIFHKDLHLSASSRSSFLFVKVVARVSETGLLIRNLELELRKKQPSRSRTRGKQTLTGLREKQLGLLTADRPGTQYTQFLAQKRWDGIFANADSRRKEKKPAYFFAPSQTFLDYLIGIGVLAYSHSLPIE